MNTQTQEVPKEKVGHPGGSDSGHRCWRCALKKALALGAVTAITSFVIDFLPENIDSFKSSVLAGAQNTRQVGVGKMADSIHRVVVLLDELSGRSTEVH